MKIAKALVFLCFSVSLASPVAADWPLGLWQSAPDRTGLVVQVRTKPCGQALCGRIERAKDRFGYDTPSSVVGRRMLLKMEEQADGSYLGRIWQPAGNRVLSARMQVSGNEMRLENCDGAVCETAVWRRVR